LAAGRKFNAELGVLTGNNGNVWRHCCYHGGERFSKRERTAEDVEDIFDLEKMWLNIYIERFY